MMEKVEEEKMFKSKKIFIAVVSPQGKESITGYSYEPWHFRYVGVDVAREICRKGVTFEEYMTTRSVSQGS